MVKQNTLDRFGARAAYLAREWLVAIELPAEGADAAIEALRAELPAVADCERRLYVTGAGQQRFRALSGACAGFEDAVPRNATVELSFSIPRDPALLDRVFETVFAVPADEAPAVRIFESWGSRRDSLAGQAGARGAWRRPAAAGTEERGGYLHSA